MTYYDSISKGYSELHREEQLKKINIIKDNIEIKPDDLLLDLGCGPYYADWPCKVIGVDPAFELLKQAKIPVIKAKAEELPFSDNKFDIVISLTAIQNFDDIEKGLLEARRVGKRVFVFTFLKKSDKSTTIQSLIYKHFSVKKIIDEDKDLIIIAKYKKQ